LKRIVILLVGFVCVAAAAPGVGAQGMTSRPALPTDVATLDGIIAAFYDVVSGGRGVPRDWARDSTLYLADARFAIARESNGRWTAGTVTHDAYARSAGPSLERGFFEREIHREVRRFGPIAHAFSTYEWRSEPGAGPPGGRGINSIELFHDGVRWWITSAAWADETPGNPIPAEYLPPPPPADAGSFASALAGAQRVLAGGDYPGARPYLRAALTHAPGQPSVLYYLARAHAAAGALPDAEDALEWLAQQGAARDLHADSAFAALRGRPRFESARAMMLANAAPAVASDTAFVLRGGDVIPEGIAWDPVSGDFLVGSLVPGGIQRIGRDGRSAPIAAADGHGWIVGLRVDADRRLLWAAAVTHDEAAPRYARGTGGRSALHAYDLTTGALIRRIAAPDDGRPHMFNDIALQPNGDLWVTDSEGNALYRLRDGSATLERVHGDDANFTYPNGITVSRDGTRVYVAHSEGLTVVRPGGAGAPAIGRVSGSHGISQGGIDGLYSCSDALLAVQARLGFQQVVVLTLDAAGDRVITAAPLERAHPAHGAATTGAIAGDAFYYIANAGLARLTPEGGSSGSGDPPVVLRLPLGGRCGG
jgi:sugar lactone lactonase YvrE